MALTLSKKVSDNAPSSRPSNKKIKQIKFSMDYDLQDLKDKISSMKGYQVPDFGEKEVLNFEDCVKLDYSENARKKPVERSYWHILYDSIRKYPRFEKLIKYIN